MLTLSTTLLPVLMLFASNVFMTFAGTATSIQGSFAGARDPRELGHAFRILAGGAGQPLGQRGHSAAQLKPSGSDHPDCVRRVLGAVSEGAAGLDHALGFASTPSARSFFFMVAPYGERAALVGRAQRAVANGAIQQGAVPDDASPAGRTMRRAMLPAATTRNSTVNRS